MKPENYDERLADYLGGEMTPADRAAFEAEVNNAPECAAEVAELQSTLATMHRLPAFDTTAADRTAAARRPRKLASGLFKAAAVLAFGMFLGRATAPTAEVPGTGRPPVEPPADIDSTTKTDSAAQVAAIHPAWIEFGRKLGAGSSSFGAPLGLQVQRPH